MPNLLPLKKPSCLNSNNSFVPWQISSREDPNGVGAIGVGASQQGNSSPPINSRYTEKWLRRQTNLPPPDEAALKSEDKVVIESPSSPVGSAANDSRIQSPTSVDSGSSNESLFAPPKAKICLHKKNEPIKKDYRHRRKIKKNHHSMIADDSPRLPTPPELRNDDERPSSAQTPLLDREQFLLEINPADRGFASKAIDQFGFDTMANVYAKDWGERKVGLEQILAVLRTNQGSPDEKLALEMALPIVKRALQDPLFQVFSVGIALFNHIVGRLVMPAVGNARLQRKFAVLTALTMAGRISDKQSDRRFAQLGIDTFGAVFEQSSSSNMANYFLSQLLANQGHSENKVLLTLGLAKIVLLGIKVLWDTRISRNDEHRICHFIAACLNSPEAQIRSIGRELAEWTYAHSVGKSRQLFRRLLPLTMDNIGTEKKIESRQLSLLHANWDEVDKKTNHS